MCLAGRARCLTVASTGVRDTRVIWRAGETASASGFVPVSPIQRLPSHGFA